MSQTATRDNTLFDSARTPGQKPVFTSSKKKNLGGGADLAEIANSRQNYDLSFLGSTAKSELYTKPAQEFSDEVRIEERQKNTRFAPPGKQDSRPAPVKELIPEMEDDGFELVKDKTRVVGQGAEISFGKPTFSRSGK